MAITADQYITQAILDDSRYVQGGRRVIQTDHAMAAAHSTSLAQSGMMLSGLTSIATAAASAITAIYAAGVTGFAMMAQSGLEAYGKIERLQKGLEATAGSAKMAAERMKELRELAKAPGLGFEEAVGAYTRLTGSGASPEFAQRLISEGANANARVGGGREEFGRILLALSQALTKRNFEGQDARQLADANIPIYKILMDRFGTGDTGELAQKGVTSAQVLNALVDEWSQLERVTGGLSNSWENLADAFEQGKASFGEGLAQLAGGSLADLTKEIELFTESGVFKMLGQDLSNSIQSVMTTIGIDGSSGLNGAAISLVGAFTYARVTLQAYTEIMAAAAQRMGEIWNLGEDVIKGIFNSVFPGSGVGIDIIDAGGGVAGGIHAQAKADAQATVQAAMNLLKANAGAQSGKGPWWDKFNNALAKEMEGGDDDGGKNGTRLERIAQATEKMASIFDKSSIGGGDLLRKGISVFEATSASQGGSSRGSANLSVALEGNIRAMIRQEMKRG